MWKRIRQFRLFLGSPSDMSDERGIVSKVIARLNVQIGTPGGFLIDLVESPETTHPGVGSEVQEVVNRQIGRCDIYVFLFWKRLGTPTKRHLSGTVEEFEYAYKQWTEDKDTEILVYLSKRPFYPSPSDLLEFPRVLSFQNEMSPKGVLFHDFKSLGELENKLSIHLAQIILNRKTHTRRGQRKWKKPLLYKLKDNRQFHTILREHVNRGDNIGLIFFDFDDFTKFRTNHPKRSEEILASVAQEISTLVGNKGELFRYVGDEFAILTVGQRDKDVMTLAEKIRTTVEAAGMLEDAKITISVGVGCSPELSGETLFSNVYGAMSVAKLIGKNQVIVCPMTDYQIAILREANARANS